MELIDVVKEKIAGTDFEGLEDDQLQHFINAVIDALEVFRSRIVAANGGTYGAATDNDAVL